MQKKAVLVISILALAVAVSMGAEPSKIVRVPVSGEYFEPAIGGAIAYEGALLLVWTQAADGPGWDVQSILAAKAWVNATGDSVTLYGFSQERVVGSPEAVVEVTPPNRFACIGGSAGFQGALGLGAELPRMAAVPAVRSVASSLVAPEPVAVPVKGQYYESAVAGQVSYEGLITLYWTRPQPGTADWTINGTLVADAVTMGTGARYVYLGFCQDCFAMAPDSTVKMAKPVYAIGVGHTGGFQGTVSMTLAMPLGAAFPTVNSISLASK